MPTDELQHNARIIAVLRSGKSITVRNNRGRIVEHAIIIMLGIGLVFTGIKGFTPSGMPFIRKKRLTGTSGKIGASLANVPIFMKISVYYGLKGADI